LVKTLQEVTVVQMTLFALERNAQESISTVDSQEMFLEDSQRNHANGLKEENLKSRNVVYGLETALEKFARTQRRIAPL